MVNLAQVGWIEGKNWRCSVRGYNMFARLLGLEDAQKYEIQLWIGVNEEKHQTSVEN